MNITKTVNQEGEVLNVCYCDRYGRPVNLEPGMQVTYRTKDHGIIKSLSDDPDFVFVVYNCSGNWDNYQDYTGEKTGIVDLELGWL